ncbi:tRNA (N(6)-L-threonylcarbamoyladenosine(37)-C(2))-methylthiotransferase [Candidatus Woesearchaeota archaeon]|nr:tRNA (N(6)-L-threonylcarbamoyladenosine(37)-C(2))-methylthiotransferase [Candidatus Woesearchaeota archaeon]
MASIFIDNYGCTANYDNGHIIAGMLIECGHEVVQDMIDADVVIINSCAVKNVTVNKIFYQIKKVKEFSDKKLIITGCMSVSEKEKLNKYLGEGVALVSTQNITHIPEVVEKILKNEQVVLINKRKEIKLGLPKLNPDNKIASIQISEGCLSYCGFCSTKLAKGNLVSYPKEQIVREVEKYVKGGYKRINLTSTDSACYGFDLGYNLVDLLKEIIQIAGEFQVRIGMGNPKHTIKYFDSLLEVMKNSKIMKFIHLPLQSGSNKVLDEMKRGHKVEDFIYMVETLKKEIPGITISTDIIVGYPTETEEDFLKTVEVVERLNFEVMNLSKFASRTGTYASKLKQLPSQLIKDRSVRLSLIYKNLKKNKINETIFIEIPKGLPIIQN